MRMYEVGENLGCSAYVLIYTLTSFQRKEMLDTLKLRNLCLK